MKAPEIWLHVLLEAAAGSDGDIVYVLETLTGR